MPSREAVEILPSPAENDRPGLTHMAFLPKKICSPVVVKTERRPDAQSPLCYKSTPLDDSKRVVVSHGNPTVQHVLTSLTKRSQFVRCDYSCQSFPPGENDDNSDLRTAFELGPPPPGTDTLDSKLSSCWQEREVSEGTSLTSEENSKKKYCRQVHVDCPKNSDWDGDDEVRVSKSPNDDHSFYLESAATAGGQHIKPESDDVPEPSKYSSKQPLAKLKRPSLQGGEMTEEEIDAICDSLYRDVPPTISDVPSVVADETIDIDPVSALPSLPFASDLARASESITFDDCHSTVSSDIADGHVCSNTVNAVMTFTRPPRRPSLSLWHRPIRSLRSFLHVGTLRRTSHVQAQRDSLQIKKCHSG